MKSIKEKAEERAPYTKTDSWGRIKAAINAQTSFEAGANYVLECIEDIIVSNEDNTLNMARCLVDCIEQLKR